jgi:hypothetical protein
MAKMNLNRCLSYEKRWDTSDFSFDNFIGRMKITFRFHKDFQRTALTSNFSSSGNFSKTHVRPLENFVPFPTHLYKYESFSTQSLLNLKSQVLYFGSPLQFNDPYDSALRVPIAQPSNAALERLRNHYLTKEKLPHDRKVQLLNATADELRASFMLGGAQALQEITENFLKNRGVTCFSESNDNLLMWSHYGGKYKGFCLEFSTQHSSFGKIWQVNYEKVLPRIELEPLLTSHSLDFIQTLFCTKSEAWSYEREWRAIHNEAGTRYGYPAECLTGVYFGPDIDQQSLEIICLILGGQNGSVKFFRGARSLTEFKVNFEAFTYTSFLEAKQRGLR